jgi:hypothetical protein
VLSSSPARFAGCRSSRLVPLPLAANRPLPVAADRVDSTHASGCRSTAALIELVLLFNVLLSVAPPPRLMRKVLFGGDAVGATEVATVTRDWSNWSNWCAVNV